jgi:hypothetical protein
MSAYFIREPSDLHFLARARADELGMSRLAIDFSAKIPGGYSSKLLADPPIKNFAIKSAIKVLRSLGLALVVVPDPEALKEIQQLIGSRDERHDPRRRRVDQPKQEARA